MFGQLAVDVGVFAIGNARAAAGNAAAGAELVSAAAAGADTAGVLAEAAAEVLLTTAVDPLVAPVAAEPIVA